RRFAYRLITLWWGSVRLLARRGMLDRKLNKFWSFNITLFLTACLVAGCSRDPQVRKKKFLDKGNAYFDKGQYREAIIEYQNAIQIDSKYADAYYHLAQALMKQGDWP